MLRYKGNRAHWDMVNVSLVIDYFTVTAHPYAFIHYLDMFFRHIQVMNIFYLVLLFVQFDFCEILLMLLSYFFVFFMIDVQYQVADYKTVWINLLLRPSTTGPVYKN